MPLPSVIRSEYFDAAIEKTSNPAEVESIRQLRLLAVALDEAERATQEQSIMNRIAAGESPTRVAGPKSAIASAERAAAEIHRLEQRKCRRASSASEILVSMIQLLDNDIEFWRPALQKIELLDNRTLAEQLLARKVAFRERLQYFVHTWQSAASQVTPSK